MELLDVAIVVPVMFVWVLVVPAVFEVVLVVLVVFVLVPVVPVVFEFVPVVVVEPLTFEFVSLLNITCSSMTVYPSFLVSSFAEAPPFPPKTPKPNKSPRIKASKAIIPSNGHNQAGQPGFLVLGFSTTGAGTAATGATGV